MDFDERFCNQIQLPQGGMWRFCYKHNCETLQQKNIAYTFATIITSKSQEVHEHKMKYGNGIKSVYNRNS